MTYLVASVDSQLIEILRKEGLVGAAQLERALALQQQSGESLATLLVRHGLVEEDDLFFLLSRHLSLPTIPAERLIHLTLDPELRRRVPKELAQACAVLPLDIDVARRRLSVAMFDPSDEQTLARLRQLADVEIVSAYLARRSVILDAIKVIYCNGAEDAVGQFDSAAAERRPRAEARETLDPLEEVETGVELIPGKVSLDASLAREISQLSSSQARQLERDTPTMTPLSPSSPTIKMRVSPELIDGVPLGPQDTAAGQGVQLPASSGTPGRPLSTQRAGSARAGVPVHRRSLEPTERGAERADLLRELFSAFGAITMQLEQRARPDDLPRSREYGQLSKRVARELGIDDFGAACIGLAAQLYGLDEALRREGGGSRLRVDVDAVFRAQPGVPGGLDGQLRRLGRRVLGLDEPHRGEEVLGPRLIALVADWLELRERVIGRPDLEQLTELLAEGDADPAMVAALRRALGSIAGMEARQGAVASPTDEVCGEETR